MRPAEAHLFGRPHVFANFSSMQRYLRFSGSRGSRRCSCACVHVLYAGGYEMHFGAGQNGLGQYQMWCFRFKIGCVCYQMALDGYQMILEHGRDTFCCGSNGF